MRLLIGTREGLRDGEGALLGLGGRAIRALAGRPDDAWLVVDGREVWRLKGGRMSVAAAAGALADPALTCVLPTPTGVLVGTEGAYLRRFSGESRLGNETLAPVAGFDQAEGREHWFTPWGGPPATRSLAIDDQRRALRQRARGRRAAVGRRRRDLAGDGLWISARTRTMSSHPRAMTGCYWPPRRAAWPSRVTAATLGRWTPAACTQPMPGRWLSAAPRSCSRSRVDPADRTPPSIGVTSTATSRSCAARTDCPITSTATSTLIP